MSNDIPTTKRRGRPKKAESELVINPNSIAVRNFRERKRLENEDKLLEEQRVYKNFYNKEWKTIRANKPDYCNDPPYEELASERYNKHQAHRPDNNDDKDSDKDSDKTDDKDDSDKDDSVKSSEQLNKILDDALDDISTVHSKNQKKNKKRRDKLAQQKKGNKISEPLNEDVD